MSDRSEVPFESIESAHDFVDLLAEIVAEAKNDLSADVTRETAKPASRRLDALRMASYSVEKLEHHLKTSRRILNDLRSLRRLLFEERGARPTKVAPSAPLAAPKPASILPKTPRALLPAGGNGKPVAAA